MNIFRFGMDFRTLLTFRHDLTSDNIFFSFVLRTLREAGDMTHLFSIIVRFSSVDLFFADLNPWFPGFIA